ncbi:MAG: DUF6015 family protein [Thermoplasmata archaeon]
MASENMTKELDNQLESAKIVYANSLARAIQNGIKSEERKMSYEEAYLTALHILNFFGFQNRIIDNSLEPDDRDIFYIMEDVGILETEREETTLYDGREWRIHYWILNYKRVYELREEQKNVIEEIKTDIYSEMPEDVWNRGE